MRKALQNQIDYLRSVGFTVSHYDTHLEVRDPDVCFSTPSKLKISWLGTASDRSVGRVVRAKAKRTVQATVVGSEP